MLESPPLVGAEAKPMDLIKRISQHFKDSAQTKLDAMEVEGVSGGGLVRIRCSAKGRVIGVAIDDSLMQPAEKGILEDLIAAAYNDARAKADHVAGEEMARMQQGLGLPPGFKLPF